MSERKSNIQKADDSTCGWVWSTNFERWLRQGRLRIFWIYGKPGSGKSTLMKYLSNTMPTRQHTSQPPTPWKVIDFFFDFRRLRAEGNSTEGLLISLMRQIVHKSPQMDVDLHKEVMRATSESLDILQSLFRRVVEHAKAGVLILVDGLDEFWGNNDHDISHLVELLQLFASFESCTSIKLCLASRPELVIRKYLGKFPQLDVKDHTIPAIKQFVSASAVAFQPELDALQSQELQDLIVARADGVFLWVYLAVQSIMHGCFQRSTSSELKLSLEALPQDVEEMYQRLVDRIPGQRKAEAAILYVLTSSANNGAVEAAVLHSTIQFLSTSCPMLPLPDGIASLTSFEQRLHATMGGLLEVLPGVSEESNEVVDGTTKVQLLHETVRSFSRKSQWFEKFMPVEFIKMLPDPIWPRLTAEVLVDADETARAATDAILCGKYGTHVVYPAFSQILSSFTPSKRLVARAPLLFRSIRVLVHYAEIWGETADVRLENQLNIAMKTRLASLHYILGGPHHMSAPQPPYELLANAMSNLVLAATHRAFTYLRKQEDQIRGLQDSERNELVTLVLCKSYLRTTSCSTISASITRSEDGGNPRDTIDKILCQNKHICSCTLSIYIRLGYFGVPTFLLHHWRNGTLELDCGHDMLFDAQSSSLFTTSVAPLLLWACDLNEPSDPRTTFESQLRALLMLGVNINEQDARGLNIIHYLIVKHMIAHTFLEENLVPRCLPDDDMVEAVQKLYLCERAGADFAHQYEHRTPLQAFRFGVDRVRRTPPDERQYEDIPELRVAHLDWALEHQERFGHLPQPYLGKELRGQPRIRLQNRCDICEGIGSVPLPLLPFAVTETSGGIHVSTPGRVQRPARPEASELPEITRFEDVTVISPTIAQDFTTSETNLQAPSALQAATVSVPHVRSVNTDLARSEEVIGDNLPTPRGSLTSSHRRLRGSQSSSVPGYLQSTYSSRLRSKSRGRG